MGEVGLVLRALVGGDVDVVESGDGGGGSESGQLLTELGLVGESPEEKAELGPEVAEEGESLYRVAGGGEETRDEVPSERGAEVADMEGLGNVGRAEFDKERS